MASFSELAIMKEAKNASFCFVSVLAAKETETENKKVPRIPPCNPQECPVE